MLANEDQEAFMHRMRDQFIDQGIAVEDMNLAQKRVLADTVGMSTVPEVIVARHMGLPCMAMSIITDLGVEGKIVEVTHEDVQRVAEKTGEKLTFITKELLKTI